MKTMTLEMIATIGKRAGIRFALSAAVFATLTGCHQDMWNQPRYAPLQASTMFKDGRASRMPVEGTVPYQDARLDSHYYTGMVDGQFVETLPPQIKLDEVLLRRGQERFTIFCSVCHGATGYGDGMIVQRGFKKPPSYHFDPTQENPNRLKEAAPGYIFDTITRGFGTMYSYASRVPVEDRWAIVAYVRTLQKSQDMRIGDIADPAVRKELEEMPAGH